MLSPPPIPTCTARPLEGGATSGSSAEKPGQAPPAGGRLYPGDGVHKTCRSPAPRAVERMNKVLCCLQVKPLGLLKPSSLMKVSGRFKAHQDALPRLPVPPLQQSLDHYLKALQPIVSEEEWVQTKQLVEEFQTSGGVGERLQKGLERRARKMENWVSMETRTGRVHFLVPTAGTLGFLVAPISWALILHDTQ